MITVQTNDADLVNLTAGNFMEQWPESNTRVEQGGAGAFIDSDSRTAQMATDKRIWTIKALSDLEVRQLLGQAATRAREVAGETEQPWRD